MLLLGPVRFIICNSSRIEIHSLSCDVRPRPFGVLFFKELEELCVSAELVLKGGGEISVHNSCLADARRHFLVIWCVTQVSDSCCHLLVLS